MILTLNDHETELLRGLLQDHLPALEREAARTRQHDLRHVLTERQELIERLLEQMAVVAR